MASELDFFRVEVREFDEIDTQIKTIQDKIKPLNKKIKELRAKKNELQGGICDYMKKEDINGCNLASGLLEYKETKSVKPITKAVIFDKLNDFFSKKYTDEFKQLNPDEKAKCIHTFIYEEDREYTPKTILKKKA